MAGNRVTSILEIVTKGAKEAISSFRQIATSTNDASTATNRATTANDTYHRGAKALYQTNLAQGRQISKLRAEIGGSSGLVAAYATLAANVFAASAAFNALSKAAQLDQLTQSLNFVGNAAGTNLGNLVSKLREVTGEAISTEQALRSASLGVSAGFSTDQLTNLAKVARGASLALGRDMSDAMDRLTRGAAKLEPEILDELGIIVRLDTATAAYAAQVGKAVDQLTQYERTQAFINAINEQGAKKFGAVADAIDPNPYDKLAAALSDLSKDFLDTINSILEFTGIIDGLTSSTPALVGAIVLFASTISRQLLPALYAMPVAAAKAATRLATLSKVKLQADFTNFNKLPKVLTDLSPKFAAGTASAQDFAKGMDSANRSIRASEAALTRYAAQQANSNITEAAYAKKVAETTAKLEQAKAARQSLIAFQSAQELASIKSNVATGLEAASQFRLKEGFKALSQATQENSARLAAMSQGAGVAAQTMNTLRQGFFVAGIGARFLGAALLSFLPYLGLLLTFGPMIYNFLKDKFFPKSALEEVKDRVSQTFEGIQKEFEKFAEYNSQFEITFANSFNGDKVIGAYKVLAGIASTVAEQTRKGIEAAGAETVLQVIEQRKILNEAKQKLEDLENTPPKNITLRTYEKMKDRVKTDIEEAETELENFDKVLKAGQKQAALVVLEGTISTLSSLDALKDSSPAIDAYRTKLEELRDSTKDPVEILIEIDKTAQELNNLKASIDGVPLALAEIQKAQNDLVQKQTTPLDDLISKYGELTNNLENIQNISGVDAEAILATFRADIIGITKLTEEAEQGSLSVEQAVAGYVDKLKEARSAIISITIATKSLEESSKTVSDIAGTFANVLENQVNLQNINIGLQIQSLEKQKAITNNLQQRLQFDVEIARLTKSRVGDEERAKLLAKQNLDNRKAELDIEKARADVQIQQIRNQQTINSISSLINTDTADAIDLIEQQFSRNESLAGKEAALAKDKLDIEKSIANFRLQAILELAKAELEAYKKVTDERTKQEAQLAKYRQVLAVLTQKQTAAEIANQTTNISFTVSGTREIVDLINQTARAAQAGVEATAAAGAAASNVAAQQAAAAKRASEEAKNSANAAKKKAEESEEATRPKPQPSPRAATGQSGESTATQVSPATGLPAKITVPVLVDLAQAEAALKEFIEKPRSVTVQVATTGVTPVVESLAVDGSKVQASVDNQTRSTTAKIPATVAVDTAPVAAATTAVERAVEKPIEQEITFNAETLDQSIRLIQALIGTTENDIKLDFNTSEVEQKLGNVNTELQAAQTALESSYQRNLGIINEQAEVAQDKLSADKASQILALARTKTEGQITSIIEQGAATSEALTKLEISRARQQNDANKDRIAAKKLEVEKNLELVKTDEDRIRLQSDLAAYNALELSTRLETITAEEERLKVLKAGLDVREKENNITLQSKELAIEVLKNQKALENLRKGRGSDLLVSQQLEVAEKEYSLAIDRINLEEELAKTRVEIESKLASARLTAVAAELRAYADRPGVSEEEKAQLLASAASVSSLSSTITADLATQVGFIERSAEAQRGMAKEQLTSTQISIVSQNTPQLPQMEDMGAIKLPPIDFTAMQNQFAAVRAQSELFKNQIIADSEETMMKGIQMGQSLDEAAKNANEKADLSTFASKVQSGFDLATAAASPFIEQLKGLGPEGQYVAAIAQGGLQVVDSISTISEAFATLGDKTATSGSKLEAAASIMQSVGASIGAIGAMQQAASAQRVAEIDKEIAAEKKRDGKSKESLAKIAALEKKKVQEEKKAFERNKKMKMAEIVINTAAAVMGIWSGVKDPLFSPVIAAAQSALVIGLGAAQLAIVSGTSFQGGGSIGGASVPTSISVGERSNKVDVAQRPTGGELAYIQGERGMGTNANNFRPAFMGARYRATGGYIVGEQGPELFVPETPGRIVPNDEMGQMGTPVNVSFNVSAIDAVSFNDMLADQKGNIISIIREAANSYGQPFLEGVNTITMAPAQRNYYRKA